MVGVGVELVVWTMTAVASLEVASYEVDLVRALSALAFGFLGTMFGVDSSILDASVVIVVGLETILLGLVFSRSFMGVTNFIRENIDYLTIF